MDREERIKEARRRAAKTLAMRMAGNERPVRRTISEPVIKKTKKSKRKRPSGAIAPPPRRSEVNDRATMQGSVAWLAHLPKPLCGCWYLDKHFDFDLERRTEIGELVYNAKTYGLKPGSRSAADRLGGLMATAAGQVATDRHFPIATASMVVPVPAFPTKEPFNLPDILAGAVAKRLNKPYSGSLLVKFAETEPAKTTSPERLRGQLRRAHRVRGDLSGQTILLVDDLVRSGTTLATLAQVLHDAGASRVGAFAATRAAHGMAYDQ